MCVKLRCRCQLGQIPGGWGVRLGRGARVPRSLLLTDCTTQRKDDEHLCSTFEVLTGQNSICHAATACTMPEQPAKRLQNRWKTGLSNSTPKKRSAWKRFVRYKEKNKLRACGLLQSQTANVIKANQIECTTQDTVKWSACLRYVSTLFLAEFPCCSAHAGKTPSWGASAYTGPPPAEPFKRHCTSTGKWAGPT